MEVVPEEEFLMPSSNIHQRKLSLVQLLLLNAIVCGLEFCASAAFTYIPPMLLKAGLDEEHMSIVMGVGPFLGFLLVPVIGGARDRCRSRFGRRRPFILGLSILLIISLLIIPYGELFGIYAFGRGTFAKRMGVWLLIFGAVLLDFTSQVTLTPCEALLSDACKNTDQQDRCFMVYSFMVSLGGCIGYLITALDWGSNNVGIWFGGQEQAAFSIMIILFIFAMLATLGTAEESPVERERTTEQLRNDKIHQMIVKQKETTIGIPPNDPGYESGSNENISDDLNGSRSTDSDKSKSQLPFILDRHKACNLPWTRWTFLYFDSLFFLVRSKLFSLLPRHIQALFEVPFVLRRLALANFFSWTAVMGFNLFYTDYVGQAIYGGNPNAPEGSRERELFDEGVRMGSWGLFFHCITSAIYASLVEKMTRRYGSKSTYIFGMASFTVAIGVMTFVKHIYLVNLMASMTGIGFATLTTIPFMLVTSYHEDKEIFYFDTKPEVPTTHRGTGVDMATLDTAYFLSQVLLSFLMSYIVHFTGSVLTYVVVAGAMGAVACACASRIIFNKSQLTQLLQANARKN